MCGIVGLLAKNERTRAELGPLLEPMLIGMTGRGPDSAGFAVFGAPAGDLARLNLTSPPGFDWTALAAELAAAFPAIVSVEGRARHGLVVAHEIGRAHV